MIRQFTATCFIIENDKALLIHHKKFNKWLPPGGHIDPNETPDEAVLREIREEVGLEVELVHQENIWINKPHAKSFPRPFLCMLQEVPAFKDVAAHQHMDMIYVARPKRGNNGGMEILNKDELHDMRWFSKEDLKKLKSDEIFPEIIDTIELILSTPKLFSPLADAKLEVSIHGA